MLNKERKEGVLRSTMERRPWGMALGRVGTLVDFIIFIRLAGFPSSKGDSKPVVGT